MPRALRNGPSTEKDNSTSKRPATRGRSGAPRKTYSSTQPPKVKESSGSGKGGTKSSKRRRKDPSPPLDPISSSDESVSSPPRTPSRHAPQPPLHPPLPPTQPPNQPEWQAALTSTNERVSSLAAAVEKLVKNVSTPTSQPPATWHAMANSTPPFPPPPPAAIIIAATDPPFWRKQHRHVRRRSWRGC